MFAHGRTQIVSPSSTPQYYGYRCLKMEQPKGLHMSLPYLHGKGFLLSDGVELKFSKNGNAYANLPLSFRNNKKDASGQWTFDKEIKVEVTVFGALAESLCEQVSGRTELAVAGQPYFETYTDKNGNDRVAVRMVADSVWPTKEGPRAKQADEAVQVPF